MFFTILYLVLAFGGFGSLMYFTGMYLHWYFYFIPLVGIPLSYLILFGLTLAIIFPFAKATNIDKEIKKPSHFARWLVKQIDFLIIQLSLTRVKYTGFKKLDPKKEYMIIYNHISNFDPMLIMNKVKRLICITKYGNKKAPIAGGMIHRAGYITIDREHDNEGIKAITKAIEYINTHEASICVSPEGTRSKDLTLLPFHPGTFNIAKRTNVPIVCVGIKNTNLIHKNFPKKFTKAKCDVIHIMQPEEYYELSTVEIANQLHQVFEQYLAN